MSRRHATAAELELYVLGALDADRVESFEVHCAQCDACAAALSGEASLELSFEQVARRTVQVVPARRGSEKVRTVAYGVAGLVAMAATVLLWMGRPAATGAGGAGESTAAVGHAPLDDGAILDARNDALDGG